jgi:hypothetical protein
MLKLPTRGISRSINQHNVELDVFCDWIESCVLFDDPELSASDVVDALMEENIYEDADMAAQRVDDAWTEIRRRHSWIRDGSPFVVDSRRITRLRTWKAVSAHSFCLLLSLAQWYRGWAEQFGFNYIDQGELFEELTKESLLLQFSGWQVFRTGWSSTHCQDLSNIVSQVASALGESTGDVKRWTGDRAKDGELDLVCCRPFLDARVGIPVFLMQCASGADWDQKLHTPRLEIWTKIIHWASCPKKGFAVPLALDDGAFVAKCGLVNGMLLDRYRILAAGAHKRDWVSSALRKRLIAWSRPRVQALPRKN